MSNTETGNDVPLEDVSREPAGDVYDMGEGHPDETKPKPPPKKGAAKKAAEEKKPQPVKRGPRQPINELAGIFWTGVGTVLEQTQLDAPVGRVMQFQAPVAGATIDDVVKNTWLDELIQPFVQKAGAVEGIGSLLALPVLVGALERRPSMAFAIEPMLVMALESQMAEVAPAMKKQQKERRDRAKTVADYTDMLDLDKDADPISEMLGYIFGIDPDLMQHPEGESEGGTGDE